MGESWKSQQKVVVEQQVLTDLSNLKQQLQVLSTYSDLVDGKYMYIPLPDFLATFLWLLDTNQVSYLLIE